MKIVLNNEERKSFEGFIIEYVISCKSALEYVGSDDALEMLKPLEGKNDAEILSELYKESGIGAFVEIVKETQIETTYNVNAEILIAYNQYMSTSARILRPYTDRLTSILHTNRDELTALSKKMPKFKVSVVNNILKGLFAMVGLEGLYVELFDLITKFKTDEEGMATMKRLRGQLSDRVKSNIIMTDYLNDK